MKTNLIARLTICALAATAVPVPRAVAQLPPPAPPVTAGDSKELDAALELMRAEKWKDAMQALERWRDKFAKHSPRAIEAKYNLALSYLHQDKPLHDDAARELRQLMKEPETKVPAASKEQFQLLIAKAITLKAFEMPADNDVQKGAQVKMIEEAIKEYNTFLTSYPNSRSGDTAWFLSGALALQAEQWEEAVKRFNFVYKSYPQSALRMPALMNAGKTFLSKGYALLTPKAGKEPEEAQIKEAITVFETNALPALQAAYTESRDLALMNEAVYYIGQIQLTRSQNVALPDEEAKKKRQGELLTASLDAFRAVRSREEVIQDQDRKLTEFRKAISLLNPANPTEYLATKNYYENLIQMEEDKKKKFLDEQDQFLGARLAIARIFLFLKKADECRSLIRYLQGQKEVFDAEKNKEAAKDAQANIAAILALTYLEQKNLEKGTEAAEAFRAAFKGNDAGENVPLLLANLNLEKGKADAAEAIIRQAEADYKVGNNEWRFKLDGNQILVGVAIEKGDLEKALSLVNDLLGTNPKPDVEEQTLFLKGTVLRAIASQKGDSKKADEAMTVLGGLRTKYPNGAKAEEAWFEQCSITAGRDPVNAKVELGKFLDQFSKGGGKSENTAKNVAVAQFLLGKVLTALSGQNPPAAKIEDAIKAFRTVVEKWPESEPAPGAFFKIFDIHNERKEYNTCVKLMEEFLQKYPKHENVYFAYNNIAEILFSGALKAKAPDGKPALPGATGVADIEAGAKKLVEFVDYEVAFTPEAGKEPPAKRGDGSMIKVADRWKKELTKLPPYITLNAEQKLTFQKCVDGMIASIEKLMGSYPDSPRFAEGLERVVDAQTAMLKAQQTTAEKGEAFFRGLITKYGKGAGAEAKILFALAAFLQDTDAAKAQKIRDEAFGKSGGAADKKAEPTLTPGNYDRRITDLFEQKKLDEITPIIARIRAEYPLDEKADLATVKLDVRDAQAVAMFWEAKVLGEQGKAVEAGVIYDTLKKKFPASEKVFEADYGIILGAFTAGNTPADAEVRLTNIVKSVNKMKSFELPAKALFLLAQIQEKAGDIEPAIANYQKIHARYASVPKLAAAGLWAAAQLLEKQSTGAVKIRTPKELQAIEAEKVKKRKEAEEAEKKKTDAAKPADPKAGDKKPDGKKPATSEGTKPAAKPDEKATVKTEAAPK